MREGRERDGGRERGGGETERKREDRDKDSVRQAEGENRSTKATAEQILWDVIVSVRSTAVWTGHSGKTWSCVWTHLRGTALPFATSGRSA